jgi:hypothetical protein
VPVSEDMITPVVIVRLGDQPHLQLWQACLT